MDISYVPMSRGFVYLVAVIDWHSRRLLASTPVDPEGHGVRHRGRRRWRSLSTASRRSSTPTRAVNSGSWNRRNMVFPTCAGRSRAIELEPRTGCASHRCLSLGPKQRDPVASTCKSSKSVQIIGASSWQRCGRTRPQDERVAVVTFVSLGSGAVWHRLWGIALSHLSR